MGKEECLDRSKRRINEVLSWLYDDGYKEGLTKGWDEVRNLRSECVREAGKGDAEYAKDWDDHTPFYGWCSQCKCPHSGRWAHIWEYCPWCGAKVTHGDKDPYPTGVRFISGKMQEIKDMCADINPEKIKAHDTDESLRGFCGAWNRRMEEMLNAIGDGE